MLVSGRLEAELQLPVLGELVDDLVDVSMVQSVEALADDVPGNVVRIIVLDGRAGVHAPGDGGFELTEPVEELLLVGEVQLGQLLHQAVVRGLRRDDAFLVLLGRCDPFGGIAPRFGCGVLCLEPVPMLTIYYIWCIFMSVCCPLKIRLT